MATNGTLNVCNQSNPISREELILQHLPQTRFIAQGLAKRLPPDVQMEDLISEGTLGLLNAAEKFDESRGLKFKTYAEVRIRGAILDWLRKQDWAPRSLREKGRELQKASQLIEQREGRAAEDREVADELGMGIHDY
ncbi:MAG: sigma-70 family RNA polymerase sigma factor, partial [Acidobacteriota bacterium]